MILLFLSTTAFPSSLSENHKKAIEQLAECKTLLEQEKQRWEVIHNNPVTDKWSVSKDKDDNMIIKVVIDDTIKNIINDQPIQREYKLVPTKSSLIKYADVLAGFSFLTEEGPRPLLGIGYRPSFAKGAGISITTSLTSIGASVYYTNPAIKNMFIAAGGGINLKAKPVFFIGVGVLF